MARFRFCLVFFIFIPVFFQSFDDYDDDDDLFIFFYIFNANELFKYDDDDFEFVAFPIIFLVYHRFANSFNM